MLHRAVTFFNIYGTLGKKGISLDFEKIPECPEVALNSRFCFQVLFTVRHSIFVLSIAF